MEMAKVADIPNSPLLKKNRIDMQMKHVYSIYIYIQYIAI